MTEKEIINESYDGTVEQLFRTFFNEFTLAHGDPDTENAAKERFRKGILHARHVRDLALGLVP
jgi:hypothetical protein